jgi:hypothetical protein
MTSGYAGRYAYTLDRKRRLSIEWWHTGCRLCPV